MTSETAIQNQTRRDFAYIGPVWRNNSGADLIVDDYGNQRMVRYGLGNDSKEINREIKSSDLICITPVLITPAMYGQILGVFTALECKPSNWTFDGRRERDRGQLKFHDIVRDHGGFAGFVNDPAQIHSIIKRG